MQRIWKYEISHIVAPASYILELPPHARILSIQIQREVLCFWILFEHNLLLNYGEEFRTFKIIGTGQDFDYDRATIYLATVQDGEYVWHIFEQTDQRRFKKDSCSG